MTRSSASRAAIGASARGSTPRIRNTVRAPIAAYAYVHMHAYVVLLYSVDYVGCGLCLYRAVASIAQGCGLHYTGLQPLLTSTHLYQPRQHCLATDLVRVPGGQKAGEASVLGGASEGLQGCPAGRSHTRPRGSAPEPRGAAVRERERGRLEPQEAPLCRRQVDLAFGPAGMRRLAEEPIKATAELRG